MGGLPWVAGEMNDSYANGVAPAANADATPWVNFNFIRPPHTPTAFRPLAQTDFSSIARPRPIRGSTRRSPGCTRRPAGRLPCRRPLVGRIVGRRQVERLVAHGARDKFAKSGKSAPHCPSAAITSATHRSRLGCRRRSLSLSFRVRGRRWCPVRAAGSESVQQRRIAGITFSHG